MHLVIIEEIKAHNYPTFHLLCFSTRESHDRSVTSFILLLENHYAFRTKMINNGFTKIKNVHNHINSNIKAYQYLSDRQILIIIYFKVHFRFKKLYPKIRLTKKPLRLIFSLVSNVYLYPASNLVE